MEDLVRVRIVEATKNYSPMTDTLILALRLEPLETILLNGEEVESLFTSVLADVNARSGSQRQAQLRYVLNLKPIYTDEEENTVSEFSEVEIQSMPGKEFLAAINTVTILGFKERVRVLKFYRLRY